MSAPGSLLPARRPRLSARSARLMLAREMWVHEHGTYDYTAWDEDTLPTSTYDTYIEKADKAIRFAMEQGWT